MKKINKNEYGIEKNLLKIAILHFKMEQSLGCWKDEEQLKEHKTNLKKLDAMNKQETEEWKKKWLR